MRRISYKRYVALLVFFMVLWSCPDGMSSRMRSVAVASLAPAWWGLSALKGGVMRLLTIAPIGVSNNPQQQKQIEQLKMENQLLREQVDNVRHWLLHEDRLAKQLSQVLQIRKEQGKEWSAFLERRNQELLTLLQLDVQAIPARVIYREPVSWSSCLWLNVGERENQALGRVVVCKNSPVIVGNSIVGVIEQVGQRQSKVRLITDSHLHTAVRVAREDGSRLAKGELFGSNAPLWRSREAVLQGIGFNIDFADEEGPSVPLAAAIVKLGDLLITSGLDGVFPSGFRVGIVSKVGRLKEGATSYELEAKATAGDLDELDHLTVLPPLIPSKISPGEIGFPKA